MKDNNTPVNTVDGNTEKNKNAKHHHKVSGILTIKPVNDWIRDAAKRPDPKLYFHGLIVEKENTVLFASSNVGKSILAVQIAKDIAKSEKVCYVDLELSDKQFQLRYTDPENRKEYTFPRSFIRAELDPELICTKGLEKALLYSIEGIARRGVKFIIVDNLTFICQNSEKGATATKFMMKLIQLKKQFGLTIIVIAHTPKRNGKKPITQFDLAGSSKLISFFDAGLALGRSAYDNNLRYLKQVKVRTGELIYDEENVIVLDLVKEKGYLHFVAHGYANERNLLRPATPDDDIDEIYNILRLKKEGKSLRSIAEELGISLGKVQRRLQKAQKLNIELLDDDADDVSPVLDDGNPIQPIQSIQYNQPDPASNEEEDEPDPSILLLRRKCPVS